MDREREGGREGEREPCIFQPCLQCTYLATSEKVIESCIPPLVMNIVTG